MGTYYSGAETVKQWLGDDNIEVHQISPNYKWVPEGCAANLFIVKETTPDEAVAAFMAMCGGSGSIADGGPTSGRVTSRTL